MKIYILFLLCYSVNAIGIELGDSLPSSAIATNKLSMISSSHLAKTYSYKESNVIYTLTLNAEGKVNYISIDSNNFLTTNGIGVGSMLSEVKKVSTSQLHREQGWFYFIKLPSGWNAAFCKGQSCTSEKVMGTDIVNLLFKRL